MACTVMAYQWAGRPQVGPQRFLQGQEEDNRMRILTPHLLSDGLGAEEVNSAALADNHASNRVRLKTGFQPDGHFTDVREGE